MAALENIITIGNPANPTLVLRNASASANGDGVVRVGGVFKVDTVGDTLSIDEVQAIVQYGRDPDIGMTVYEVYVGPDDAIYVGPDDAIYSRVLASIPDGTRDADVNLRALPYGTPVRWSCDARTLAAFYLKNVERVRREGKYIYHLNIFSGVGLLDRVDHVGGVYTGQTFETVAADIIGGMFPFTVAAALAPQEVYNWLPYDTRRKNLHQLLFAFGASLRRDEDGKATIAFLTDTSPKSVPDDRISFGGDVDDGTPATRAEITEHAFFAANSDETVTLFDNTDGSDIAAATTVNFNDAPIHDLAVTGSLTIEESGVNYAVVSGVGTLTGKLYTHTTQIMAQDAENPTGAENIKHVTDMYLVSLANSLNVARRVLSYYSSAKTVTASIILEGERCGDVLDISDPYDDGMMAFLESMEINASSDLWGPCRMIEGYTPKYQGNNFTGSQLITASGTWTAQKDGYYRIVICSGAQGGHGGYNGAQSDHNGRGLGGESAKGGEGGRVLSFTLYLNAGNTLSFVFGIGGIGGAVGEDGAYGTDSTVSQNGVILHSTSEGSVLPNGFSDVLSGTIYAAKGADGVAGGNGGERGEAGGNVSYGGLTWNGGATDNRSGGGGAAYGSNGGVGGTEIWDEGKLDGVRGGTGATATAIVEIANYGCGGRAGNSGGGGGYSMASGTFWTSLIAPGGQGTKGNNGGNGFALIYS